MKKTIEGAIEKVLVQAGEKRTEQSHANYSNPGKYGEIIVSWNTFYEVN